MIKMTTVYWNVRKQTAGMSPGYRPVKIKYFLVYKFQKFVYFLCIFFTILYDSADSSEA